MSEAERALLMTLAHMMVRVLDAIERPTLSVAEARDLRVDLAKLMQAAAEK